MSYDEEFNEHEQLKEHIRVHINNLSAPRKDMGLNENRRDRFKTTVDYGLEDLNPKEDLAKIYMYMQSPILTLNNDKYYKVVRRVFQPCIPVMLIIDVEEM